MAIELHSVPKAIIHPQEKTPQRDHLVFIKGSFTRAKGLCLLQTLTLVPKPEVPKRHHKGESRVSRSFKSLKKTYLKIYMTQRNRLSKRTESLPSICTPRKSTLKYVKKLHRGIQNMSKDPDW